MNYIKIKMKLRMKLVLSILMSAMFFLGACKQQCERIATIATVRVSDAEMLRLLDSAGCSCVVRTGGENYFYGKPSVHDLFYLVTEEPERLRGSHVTDKPIGKSSATLMIGGGVTRVTTHLISTESIAMFREAGVDLYYEEEVPCILNRKMDAEYSLDIRLKGVDSLQVALPIIEQFLIEYDNGLIQ